MVPHWYFLSPYSGTTRPALAPLTTDYGLRTLSYRSPARVARSLDALQDSNGKRGVVPLSGFLEDIDRKIARLVRRDGPDVPRLPVSFVMSLVQIVDLSPAE